MAAWRDRTPGEALDPDPGAALTAFVDVDGTFWPPSIRQVTTQHGQVWVPYEDWQDLVGLLEAALWRERGLQARLAAVPVSYGGGTFDEAVRAAQRP